jgi:hypothetical protein
MVAKTARLEILVSITAILCALAIVLGRARDVSDDYLRQTVTTAASHFQAGISLLQARSRLATSEPLNDLGYPTGAMGQLRSDADCDAIWRRVMQVTDIMTRARFVADHDGSGDRCEYEFFSAVDGRPTMRILYWPMGSLTAVITVDQRPVDVPYGGHIFTDLG